LLSAAFALCLRPVPALAEITYSLVLRDEGRVSAEQPFLPTDRVVGFITLADEVRTGAGFFAQSPPPRHDFGLPAVLDFRFTLGEFEWTPTSGNFGILGFTDPTGRISAMLLGLERPECGMALLPCFFDIVQIGAGFAVKVYQPEGFERPRQGVYHAEGIDFVQSQRR
jgi:hypothetical protein